MCEPVCECVCVCVCVCACVCVSDSMLGTELYHYHTKLMAEDTRGVGGIAHLAPGLRVQS